MGFIKYHLPILVMLGFLPLTGCGGSSGGAVSDPLAHTETVITPDPTVTGQNSYVIDFITTKITTDPDGNLNTLSYVLKDSTYIGPVIFKQLVPFQVLDINGIPKPNVDVSIEIFNYGRNLDTIIELVPPLPGLPVVFPPDTTKVTIRTDDHGMGLFTCNVTLRAPGPGRTNTESVVYNATATIFPENINLLSYGGFIATVTQEKE